MKKFFGLLLVFSVFLVSGQQQEITYNITPSVFEESDNITITVNGSSIDEDLWSITNNALYLWSWSYDLNLSNSQDCPTNGSWTNSDEANRLTYNSDSDTYTISFIPIDFYNRTGIGRFGFLIKAKDGNGDKKSQDVLVDVGSFQVILNTPLANSTSIVNLGDDFQIEAQNTGGDASYILRANDNVISNQTSINMFNYTDANITENTSYELEVTLNGNTITKSFNVPCKSRNELSSNAN